MRLDTALTEFTYSKDHTPSSRAWYYSRLNAFFAWAVDKEVTELEGITAPLVRRYLDECKARITRTGQPLDSYTLHGHARAIRSLLFWAAAEELIDEKVAKRIALPKRAVKIMPTLTPAHLSRLFAACGTSAYPERDRAILAVLLDTGIRASELCGLTLDRVCFSADDAYLLVHGKGRKSREVGLGKRSRQLLHKYVYRHRKASTQEQHVFVGKGGKPMAAEGLDRMLYRLRDAAGLHGVRVGAHVWRHTFAFSYIAAGGDVFRLSRLLGHSSVATTQGYLTAFTSRNARKGPSVFDSME
jgi:site-specific recombinase XerD